MRPAVRTCRRKTPKRTKKPPGLFFEANVAILYKSEGGGGVVYTYLRERSERRKVVKLTCASDFFSNFKT